VSSFHSAIYLMSIGSSLRGVRWPRLEANQSPSLRKNGIIAPLPHTSSWPTYG